MTEKRFTILSSSIDYYEYWDTKEERGLTKDEVVECLNALHEENERLHNEVFRLKTELAYDRTVNDGKDWFKAEDEHLKWKSGKND